MEPLKRTEDAHSLMTNSLNIRAPPRSLSSSSSSSLSKSSVAFDKNSDDKNDVMQHSRLCATSTVHACSRSLLLLRESLDSSKNISNALRVPAERTEVLFALGTGDVSVWEERLLRCAQERLKFLVKRRETTATTECDSHMEKKRESCLESHLLSEFLFNTDRGIQLQQQNEGNNSSFLFGWFKRSSDATATLSNNNACGIYFSSFSGNDFYALMELMQCATTVPLQKCSSSSSSPPIPFLPWSETLLHALSNLLTFHGTVPAVGRFVSVLLCSYVVGLLRCRNSLARQASVEREWATRETEVGGHEKEKEKDEGEGKSKAGTAAKAAGVEGIETRETYIQILSSRDFALLLLRLAQLYFPVWRMFQDNDAKTKEFSLYTHCVPLPCFLGNALSVRGVSKSKDTSSEREQHTKPKTRRERIIHSVFDQNNTLNAGTNILFASSTSKNSANKESSAATGNKAEQRKDELLQWVHVQEVMVCVSLAETGRLALLHEYWDAVEERESDVARHMERKENQQQQQQQQQPVFTEKWNESTARFSRCVHRCGGCSNSSMMNTSAKMLFEVNEEWQRWNDDSVRTVNTTSQQSEQQTKNCNHRWIVSVTRDILETVCRATGGELSVPFESQQKICNESSLQQDYYYLNLLLTCCCVAERSLPASLLPFAIQLTHFSLLYAVIGSVEESVSSTLASKPSESKKNMETERFGVRSSNKNVNLDDDEDEALLIAAGTTCVSACKVLRVGYGHGYLISNNEHILYLSRVLQQQIQLWEDCLRCVVLFEAPLFLSTEEGNTVGNKRKDVLSPTARKAAKGSIRSTLHYQELHQQSRWRVLWWRTLTVLECLYVFRDLFRFASTWSIVSDIRPFRAVVQKIARVLQLVCWTYTKKEETSHSLPLFSTATTSSTHLLSPFPVLASLGRRFFVGAMLVYVLNVTTDVLLCFHRWINECATLSSGSELDDDVVWTHDAPAEDSSPLEERWQRTTHSLPTMSHTQLWLHDLYWLVLLPACVRVQQSIAVCAPEEAMLPAIFRLHSLVESNTLSDEKMLHHNSTLHSYSDGGNLNLRREKKFGVSLGGAVAFAETLRISMEVMTIATELESTLRRSVALLPLPLSLSTSALYDENGMVLWLPYHRQLVVYLVEHLVLHAPWATWTLNSNHQTYSENSVTNPVVKYTTNAALTQGVDVINLKRLFPQTPVFSPPPPPLFDARYVTHVVCTLIQLLQMDACKSGETIQMDYPPLQHFHKLLFGIINSTFRAAEVAVYHRSLLYEQLRRLLYQEQLQTEQSNETNAGVSTWYSLLNASLLNNMMVSWLFASHDSDTEQRVNMCTEVIEAYVAYHQHHVCESVLFIAALHRKMLQQLFEQKCDIPNGTNACVACGMAAFQLLTQHTLESLFADSAVPATFHLTPLFSLNDDGNFALSFADRFSIAALLPWRPLFLCTEEQAPQQKQYCCGVQYATWEGSPPLTGVALEQAKTLVRVMAMMASLTKVLRERGQDDAKRECGTIQTTVQTNCMKRTVFAGTEPMFVLHPAALSFTQWRKLAFALRAMKAAEAKNLSPSPCTLCHAHGEPLAPQHNGDREVCFACCKSVECERWLVPYVEAALDTINCTRTDILICRVTTVEERRKLFVIFLVLRRSIESVGVFGNATGNEEKMMKSNKEVQSQPQQPQKRLMLLPQRSRRETERLLLHTIAAFAFGMRELRSAEELLC